MKITKRLSPGKTIVSFEFFPPKTDKGWANLTQSIETLLPLKPGYVSVTYGAGGSTREKTHALVSKIQGEVGLDVVAHLTCVSANKMDIAEILDRYEEVGVSNILALRGDLPAGVKDDGSPYKDFPYAADLVSFIRESKPHFGIGVAGFPEGHPDCPNRLEEIIHLKKKVDAGADYIVTQLFFDNRDYFDFVDRCRLGGIDVPIIAGIMPVASLSSMQRMAELSPGTRFPAALLKAVKRADNDAAVARVGNHWASEQVRGLLDAGVPGIHLYTLNHSKATIEICSNLGMASF